MMQRLKQPRWYRTIAALAGCVLLIVAVRPLLERAARARIEWAAARRGMTVQIESVHVGLWPLVRLDGLQLDLGHGAHLTAGAVAATWFGHPRIALHAASLRLPGGLEVASPESVWQWAGRSDGTVDITLKGPAHGLQLRREETAAGTTWRAEVHALTLGGLFVLKEHDRPVLTAGTATDHVEVHASPSAIGFRRQLAMNFAQCGGLNEAPVTLGYCAPEHPNP
jgi:hypothetical protein